MNAQYSEILVGMAYPNNDEDEVKCAMYVGGSIFHMNLVGVQSLIEDLQRMEKRLQECMDEKEE